MEKGSWRTACRISIPRQQVLPLKCFSPDLLTLAVPEPYSPLSTPGSDRPSEY